MLTKYRVKGRFKEARIEEVQVLRETDKCVFLPSWRGGNAEIRENKISEWGEYYDTWEDAHAALVRDAEARLESAVQRLAVVQEYASKVRCMLKPTAVGAA